jgi:hypothetical protein
VSADAWLTLVVVLATMGLLASERVSAPLAIVGAVTVLLLTKSSTPTKRSPVSRTRP